MSHPRIAVITAFTLLLTAGPLVGAGDDVEIELAPLWKLDLDRGPLLRNITDVLFHGDEVCVLDGPSLTIHFYETLSGTHLRSLDIRGEGPGEMTAALALLDMSATTISVLSPFGPTLHHLDIHGGPSFELGSSVSRLRPGGLRSSEQSYRALERCGGESYRIAVTKNGQLEITLERPFRSRSRTQHEREVARIRELGGPHGAAVFESMDGILRLHEFAADIRGMHEHRGMLWVRTSRSDDVGRGRLYDRFKPDGRFLGRTLLRLEGLPWTSIRTRFHDDYVALFRTGDHEGLPELTMTRMTTKEAP